MSDVPRAEPTSHPLLRPAASVMLARPSSDGFELFMVRRSGRSAFAPDAFVFPGGTLDLEDDAPELLARTLGLEPDRLTREFRATAPPELPTDAPPGNLVHRAGLSLAALRELFEESGILLACDAHGTPVGANGLARAGAADAREELRRHRRSFAAFLTANDWYADTRALSFFSRWVTPPGGPRRYDTHFFFAVAPRDQAARSDEHEVHDGLWIAPSEALTRYRAGDFYLVYPTIKHLERLAALPSLEAALAFARSKPVLTIAPYAHPDDGFAMPPSLENAW